MAGPHQLTNDEYYQLVEETFQEARQEFIAFQNQLAGKELEEHKKVVEKIKANKNNINHLNAALISLGRKKNSLEKQILEKCHLTPTDEIKFSEKSLLTDEEKANFHCLIILKECAYFNKLLIQRSFNPEFERQPELLDDLNLAATIHGTLESAQTASTTAGLIKKTLILTVEFIPPVRLAISGFAAIWDAIQTLVTQQKTTSATIKAAASMAIFGLCVGMILCTPLALILGPISMGVGLCRDGFIFFDTKKVLENEQAALKEVTVLAQRSFARIGKRQEFYTHEINRHNDNIKKIRSVLFEKKKAFYLSIATVVGAILLVPPATPIGISILITTLVIKLVPKLCMLAYWVGKKLKQIKNCILRDPKKESEIVADEKPQLELGAQHSESKVVPGSVTNIFRRIEMKETRRAEVNAIEPEKKKIELEQSQQDKDFFSLFSPKQLKVAQPLELFESKSTVSHDSPLSPSIVYKTL